MSAPRPGARGPGPGRRWRAGGPGGLRGCPLLTLSCRHYPGWAGSGVGDAGLRMEEGSERLTGRGREARRHPERRAVPELQRNPGSLPTQPDRVSGRQRSALGFPPRRRSDAHRPLPPSPRPLLARRRRGSRRGGKWRAMAALPFRRSRRWGSLRSCESGSEVGVYQVVAAGEGTWGGGRGGCSLCERRDVHPASPITPVLEAGK